jgi:hypothetical protein
VVFEVNDKVEVIGPNSATLLTDIYTALLEIIDEPGFLDNDIVAVSRTEGLDLVELGHSSCSARRRFALASQIGYTVQLIIPIELLSVESMH